MDKCIICGKGIRRSGSNWIVTPNGITHKKCPKDKLTKEESVDYKRLKDRIAYHCNTNARGYIAENGMNFMRALQVVKQLHESGYSYNEIEYTLDKTVEQLGGFWGIKQVTNRIDVIVAKKRDMEQKSQLYKDKKTQEEAIDLRSLITNDWSEDEW